MNSISEKLFISHVVSGLHPDSGGPSRTVVQLVDALARYGEQVSLVSQSYGMDPIITPRESAVDIHIEKSNSKIATKLGLPLLQVLNQLCTHERPLVLHSHGLWTPANHWASYASRRWQCPLIIQPRGMLEPWAIKHKRLKKILAMTLYQRNDLEQAGLMIATAENEYESIRSLGFKQPVAIIPNGVKFELNDHFISIHKLKKDKRTVLFLSRIHEKKGLINLVQSWGQIKPAGWKLKIAGPDEDRYLTKVMTRVNELGIADSVEYVGVADDMTKVDLFRNSDLFVLPTFSENFGVVVAEALANGLPVITTKGAPWADLKKFKCGWWIDIGVEPLVSALRTAISLSDAERQAMGARGREYVRRYDWDDIAASMVEVYRWVLGQTEKPDTVQLN